MKINMPSPGILLTRFLALIGCAALRLMAQPDVISTVANFAAGPTSLTGIAVDGNENLYVTDSTNNLVYKISFAGLVQTLAGASGVAGSIDGLGIAARFNQPTGIAVDASGNIFVSDRGSHIIRKITAAGAVSTVAGIAGVSGFEDGGPGMARFNAPGALTIDGVGNVLIADSGNGAIRKLTPSGVVSTVASSTHGGAPLGIAIDKAGVIYFTEGPAIGANAGETTLPASSLLKFSTRARSLLE